MAAAGAAGRKAPPLPSVSCRAFYGGDWARLTVSLPGDVGSKAGGRVLVERMKQDVGELVLAADEAPLVDRLLLSTKFWLQTVTEGSSTLPRFACIHYETHARSEERGAPDAKLETGVSFTGDLEQVAAVVALLEKHAGYVQADVESSDEEMDIGIYGTHEGALGTDLLRAPTLVQEGTADAAARITRQLQREKKRSVDEVVHHFVAHARCFVDEAGRRALMERVDAVVVDDQADTKLVLTVAELEGVVGAAAVAEMQAAFGVSIAEVKLRRVAATPEREVINFHLDFAHHTMGIPLNDATEYEGSRLLYAIPGEGVVAAPRGKAGSATVHDNTLPHGVTPLTRGVRYGLFLLNHTA